jgi:hypothetical protein
MPTWSVLIEAAGRRPSAAAIDAFVDAMLEHSGIVSIPQDRSGYGARMTVDAPDPASATARALDLFLSRSEAAGLAAAPIVRVEALTETELERELAQPAFPELVGVGEIAELLGVTRQRASEVQTRAGFPAPVARLKSGPVWTRASITRFVDGWIRRPGRPARDRNTSGLGAASRG